jgi:hypothetical protein
MLFPDSRQFSRNDYRERRFQATELAAALHHFIQSKSILENYSVGDFERGNCKN